MPKTREDLREEILEELNNYATKITNLILEIESSIRESSNAGENVYLEELKKDLHEVKVLIVFTQEKFDAIIKRSTLYAVKTD